VPFVAARLRVDPGAHGDPGAVAETAVPQRQHPRRAEQAGDLGDGAAPETGVAVIDRVPAEPVTDRAGRERTVGHRPLRRLDVEAGGARAMSWEAKTRAIPPARASAR
jgi:hypothetical protein